MIRLTRCARFNNRIVVKYTIKYVRILSIITSVTMFISYKMYILLYKSIDMW